MELVPCTNTAPDDGGTLEVSIRVFLLPHNGSEYAHHGHKGLHLTRSAGVKPAVALEISPA